MSCIYVGFDDITDTGFAHELLVDGLREQIKSGNTVVIEHRFCNAPSQEIARLDTIEHFDEWNKTRMR